MVMPAYDAFAILSLLDPQLSQSDEPVLRQPVRELRTTHASDLTAACLKGLAHLEWLQLAGSDLDDAALRRLVPAMPRLRWLGLAGTAVTDAGVADLARLSNLETLVLSGTKVTDAGLAHLEQLLKLRTIYLVDTQVTFAGVASFCRAIPGLIVR